MPNYQPVVAVAIALLLIAAGCDRSEPQQSAKPSKAAGTATKKSATPVISADAVPAQTPAQASSVPAIVRTIAVLNGAGKDAVAEPLPTLLMTHLGEQSHLRLVERDRLDVAMRELAQSVAGGSDAATVLRLGMLLGADAFVMLSAGDKSVPGSINLRVVETRGGLLLDEGLIEPALFTPNLQPLSKRLLDAFARVPEQNARTRYVGLLDVRSEAVGSSLDAAADELRTIIGAELRRQVDVFMVERGDLRRLFDEGAMTDLPVALRNSSTLLECGVRQESGTLTVTLKARGPGGRSIPDQVLTKLAPDLTAAREQIAGALATLLSITPTAATSDPAREAAAFTERASVLASFGRLREAALAAEVALVIDPSFNRRRLAHHYWQRAASETPRFLLAPDRSYRPLNGDQHYEAAIRAARLQLELIADLATTARQPLPPLVDRSLDNPAAAKPQFGELHLRFASLGLTLERRYPLDNLFDKSVSFAVDPADAELARLRTQLRELCLLRYDRLLQICREHGWPTGDLIGQRLVATQTFCKSTEEANRWIDECLQHFHTEEARKGLPTASKTRFYVRLAAALQPSLTPYYYKFAVPTAARWVEHPDFMTRAVAMGAVIQGIKNNRPWQAAMAGELLDLLWNELPTDEASASETFSFVAFDAFAGPDQVAVRTLAAIDPAAVLNRLVAWIQDAEKHGDATRLLVLRPMISEILAALRARPNDEHLDALESALTKLPSKPYVARHLPPLLGSIRNERAAFARKAAPAPSINSDFTITPLRVTGIPPAARPVWLAATADALLQLTSDANQYQRVQKWRLWSIPRQGGPAKSLAVGDTENAIPLGYASLGDGHYFASEAGLLIVTDGKIELHSQIGKLSLTKLSSITSFGGRLLLGLEGGISWFDPATQAAETLSSSKSVSVRNVLDGGDHYTVDSLVADPVGNCVWVGIVGGTRTGVYRWAAAGALKRIANSDQYTGGQIVVERERLLFFGRNGLTCYRPGSDSFDPSLKVLTLSPVKGPWVLVTDQTYLSTRSWAGRERYWQTTGPVVKVDGRIYWSQGGTMFSNKDRPIAEITAGTQQPEKQ